MEYIYGREDGDVSVTERRVPCGQYLLNGNLAGGRERKS